MISCIENSLFLYRKKPQSPRYRQRDLEGPWGTLRDPFHWESGPCMTLPRGKAETKVDLGGPGRGERPGPKRFRKMTNFIPVDLRRAAGRAPGDQRDPGRPERPLFTLNSPSLNFGGVGGGQPCITVKQPRFDPRSRPSEGRLPGPLGSP